MQCQCDAKNTPVAEIQDRKGTPFDHFFEVLSTNQRAGFSALDQSEASISARFRASVKTEPIQFTVTLPLECHSEDSKIHTYSIIATSMPMEFQFSANGMQIECQ